MAYLNETGLAHLTQSLKQIMNDKVVGLVNEEYVNNALNSFLLEFEPIGATKMWFSDIAPENHLILNGQAVSRTEYPELFNLWGTRYGAGDGNTTFNIPDMCDYVPIGKSDTDTNINELGKKYGEKTHTLTVNELAEHTHEQNSHNHGGRYKSFNGTANTGGYAYLRRIDSSDSYDGDCTVTNNTTATNKNTGRNTPHNNMQPSIAVNFIVKAKHNINVVNGDEVNY